MSRYKTVNLKEKVYYRLRELLKRNERFSEGLNRILDELEALRRD